MSTLLPLLALVAAPLQVTAERHDLRPFPCDRGYWEAPFQHETKGFNPSPGATFEAVHLALIPAGAQRGKLLLMDFNEGQALGSAWTQRWSIVDVTQGQSPSFENFNLVLPTGSGDFFCAGHAWTADGDLFVAGGTSVYPGTREHPGGYLGGKLAYLYDPTAGAFGTWSQQPDMAVDRWYPSVTMLANDRLFVSGGTSNTLDPDRNDYEVFDPATGTWETMGKLRLFVGPSFPSGAFDRYPRLHLLSTGELFMAGMSVRSARIDHAASPSVWTPMDHGAFDYRWYGTSVLLPDLGATPDVVLTIGGEGQQAGMPVGTLRTVELAHAGSASSPDWDWLPAPPLNTQRMHTNAVLLPDGSVLVVGGRTNRWLDPMPTFTKTPELFRQDRERWDIMAEEASIRGYHSTTALLPDGRVLSAGGDARSFDYQIFVPPYLACGKPRPVLTSVPTTMSYGGTFTITHDVAPGSRVVLMAPASVTHHSDFGQRYVNLDILSRSRTSTKFASPVDSAAAPRGIYMLFLVSSAGVPSEAAWVHLL